MDWLISLAVWLTINVIHLLIGYVVWPLAKFASGYLYYLLYGAFLTFLWKLRYEIYNEDLKLKPSDIKNRVLLITGAGSGIGLALARYFLDRGFIIVACYYSKNEPGYEKLKQLESAEQDQEPRLYLIELDVRSQDSISSCGASVRKILATDETLKLHAVLNVAGVGSFQKFQWTPTATIKNIVETNLTGSILVTREFLSTLIRTPGARVINVSSPLGIFPFPFGSVYGPTKAGLAHFSGTLESDTANYGLKTVTIQPGDLMQNTSIISSSFGVKMDDLMQELTDEERELYRDEMTKHQRLLDVVARLHQRKKSFVDLRPIRKFAVIASGGLIEDKLEDSVNFLRNFDNSVCLWDPPREMFVGNMLFNLIVGSLLQWTPRILLRDGILNNRERINWIR